MRRPAARVRDVPGRLLLQRKVDRRSMPLWKRTRMRSRERLLPIGRLRTDDEGLAVRFLTCDQGACAARGDVHRCEGGAAVRPAAYRTWAIALAFIAACGASVEDTPVKGASGIDRSKRLASLSDTEVAALCDWMYSDAGLGPYEKRIVCSDGGIVVNIARTDCINAFAAVPDTCSATVAGSEECVRALSGSACNLSPKRPAACEEPADCKKPSTG